MERQFDQRVPNYFLAELEEKLLEEEIDYVHVG